MINNLASRPDKVIALLCLCALTVQFSASLSACREKSDEKQILLTLNGYMKAHASGDYAASYDYLSPINKEKTTRKEWIATQSKAVNAIRLMKHASLENIVINGDVATATLHYQGIPSETLTNVITSIFMNNISQSMSTVNAEAEIYFIEHFDELSAPQSQNLIFVRTREGWKMLLDLKDKLSETSENASHQ